MIKGILLDIDNTLYDYEKAHTAAIADVYTLVQKMFSEKDFFNLYKEAKEKVKQQLGNVASSHNRLLYFQKILEMKYPDKYFYAKRMHDRYWTSFLSGITLYEGVIDFLKLYSRNQICIVTDLNADIQYRKIKKLRLEKYIGHLVTSEEVGVEKPNPKIFQIALEKLRLKKEEVCMVGDSYEKDILGALNLDIKPFWKTIQTKETKKITIFNDFAELKDMLK